ncbi:putative tetratricopeptide-like helical domain superfamily [Helianthus annuus]|uniref:Putative pentatricopeptide repeat protein n=1 Tax=Helianthus annuus TaxID=4232 RepID=A0A251T4D2_HELAN|nr:putative tetratricopeptide-like helical domain superfamily [Helianthus annuus]KAJ0489818.1 putative tetratricopeptide-like helical domain superfamily [Helianthus annuus]KAJ0493825.1 putative tetratricopeptide-like helical domain superfamily [Helianthus annuus]KAJ0505732.1 putative tetratricopeptide-like helical domain superfamily [Helianthus annuus]KAJ0675401.1 putative tetratricopeptide-like helical domain superfamily [Helianthus annuus]
MRPKQFLSTSPSYSCSYCQIWDATRFVFHDVTSLVNVYGKCGAMEAARKVFGHLSKRNVVTWTSLMSGYVHNSQPEEAIHVFIQMLEHGSYPTNYTI